MTCCIPGDKQEHASGCTRRTPPAPVEGPHGPWSSDRAPTPPTGTPAAGDQNLKKDAGKIPLDLLPFEALVEVGKVLQFGAQKYKAHGWRAGMEWSRLIGAALRHLFAFAKGEDTDPETGLSHLAHAACCALFLLSYRLTGKGSDDRVRP